MSKFHRIAAGAATALFTVLVAACSGNNGSIATVNGQGISRADFDGKLEASQASRQVLQQMVSEDLINQYAKDHNITISDDDLNKRINQIEAQYPPGQFEASLKTRGLTMDDVKNAVREQMILDRAVGGNVHVSESQIKAYFDKNHAAFDTPAQAKARHILVSDIKAANKVEADLKSGKDFAAEAKQYSIDPQSRDKGGELDWFRRGSMVPTFEKYVFTAPIGKVSPPVKSPFGYHIIAVEDRKPAQKATLASAHDKIADGLRQQQETPLIQPFLSGLQQKASIQVSDPRFADVFPSPLPSGPGVPAAPAPAATK